MEPDSNRIRRILDSNRKYRIDRETPSDLEIERLQASIGRRLPVDYLEFLSLGGLGDLRFSHEILAPSEIDDHLQLVREFRLVPFASNGVGDLYCWMINDLPESAVFLWDHEGAGVTRVHGSFAASLEAWRF